MMMVNLPFFAMMIVYILAVLFIGIPLYIPRYRKAMPAAGMLLILLGIRLFLSGIWEGAVMSVIGLIILFSSLLIFAVG